MTEISFFGYPLYDLLMWFWIYSFLGWAFECTYSGFHEGRLINRGFVHSPFCIIYGFGAMIIIVVLSPIKNNLILLFIFGVILTSALEYFVYILLDKLFHQKWWDYSDIRFNYKGILSLESSIAWGVFALILLKAIHPAILAVTKGISIYWGSRIIIAVTIIYSLDFIITVIMEIKKSGSSTVGILKVKTVTLRKVLINLLKKKK